MSCQEWDSVVDRGQAFEVEHVGELGIAGEPAHRGALKVAFSEFGFDQQGAETHVDLGAIDVAVEAGD